MSEWENNSDKWETLFELNGKLITEIVRYHNASMDFHNIQQQRGDNTIEIIDARAAYVLSTVRQHDLIGDMDSLIKDCPFDFVKEYVTTIGQQILVKLDK